MQMKIKTALYMGVNLWLETPNFSGIVDPKIPEELIKQIGRNLVYELGFSSLRTGELEKWLREIL